MKMKIITLMRMPLVQYQCYIKHVEVTSELFDLCCSFSLLRVADLDICKLKTGLRIILQENYRSYDSALKQTNMQTLRQRRVLLMNKFSQKAAKSERFRGWFVEESKDEERTLRTKKPTRLLKPIPCRTQRYARSSLPYMTELLSWHPPLPAPDLKMR